MVHSLHRHRNSEHDNYENAYCLSVLTSVFLSSVSRWNVCDAIPNVVYKFYQGVLHFQNVTWSCGTHIKVISFTPIREEPPLPTPIFTKHKFSTSLCTDFDIEFRQNCTKSVRSMDRNLLTQINKVCTHFHETHYH
jgi:hypothetical protein